MRRQVITCIKPAGGGLELLRRLREQAVHDVFVHHARGVGTSSRRRRGMAQYAEREVVTVLVEPARADEVFEFLYHAAGIGKPHAGLLFMERTIRAVPVTVLPGAAADSTQVGTG